jgi:hypothetical protein
MSSTMAVAGGHRLLSGLRNVAYIFLNVSQCTIRNYESIRHDLIVERFCNQKIDTKIIEIASII